VSDPSAVGQTRSPLPQHKRPVYPENGSCLHGYTPYSPVPASLGYSASPEALQHLFTSARLACWRPYQAAPKPTPNTPTSVTVKTRNIALDEPWHGKLQRGEISEADVQHAGRSYSNVASSITVVMSAIKPAGRF
jgi:hypothetical protein